MTFELTGDTCALLLVGVAHAFGTCATKCEKNGKVYIERVPGSEASSTSPNTRIWSFLERAILALLATALLYSLNIV